jgi:hypothetical protein
MINETALRDVLIALADQNKNLHLAVSTLTNELSILRETLGQIDHDVFDGVLKMQTEVFAEKASQKAACRAFPAQVPELYDEIIRRLRVGEVC